MDYPTGLLMVSLYRYNDLRTVVREALTLAARGIQRVHRYSLLVLVLEIVQICIILREQQVYLFALTLP